jgi:hypothetical protein
MENLAPSHSFLHSFCIRPAAKFESQLQGEDIIILVRAHPVTQLPWIINGLLLFILVILLNFLFSSYLSATQIFFVNISAVIFIFSYYWLKFLSYFFNAGIITQIRVIDVDFAAVIYKEVTEARLANVEDITAKSGGYFASLFNYGHVFVQTAGAHVNIEFENVPRPSDVVKVINQILRK